MVWLVSLQSQDEAPSAGQGGVPLKPSPGDAGEEGGISGGLVFREATRLGFHFSDRQEPGLSNRDHFILLLQNLGTNLWFLSPFSK